MLNPIPRDHAAIRAHAELADHLTTMRAALSPANARAVGHPLLTRPKPPGSRPSATAHAATLPKAAHPKALAKLGTVSLGEMLTGLLRS